MAGRGKRVEDNVKKHLLLIVLQLAASGNDAFWTQHNMHSGLTHPYPHESNPLARPFVRTTAGTVLYFGIGAGVKIAVPTMLRKHNHSALADAVAVGGIVDNAIGGINSVKGSSPRASNAPRQR